MNIGEEKTLEQFEETVQAMASMTGFVLTEEGKTEVKKRFEKKESVLDVIADLTRATMRHEASYFKIGS